MFWLSIRAGMAALALPVTGFVIGKVVGDYSIYPHRLLAWVGAIIGVGVYIFTLIASYRHLRDFFHWYEPEGLNASGTLAVAAEAATFYMSVSSVIMKSEWAFWGSIIGAFVVFWGNWQSMLRASMTPPKRRGRPRKAATADVVKVGSYVPPSTNSTRRRRRRVKEEEPKG